MLTKDPTGVVTMRDAHSGRRACPDVECRRRYRRAVYAQALTGIRSLSKQLGVVPKFLSVTLHGAAIAVPLEWFAPADPKAHDVFMHSTFSLEHEGRVRPVWLDKRSRQMVTVPPWGPMAYRYIAACWNRFVSSVRYHLRKRRRAEHRVFWYFRVVEEQRRGAPHYHALVVAPYMKKGQLQRLATKAGLGWIDIKRAAPETHAEYVSKLASYASKTILSGADLPRGQRFYSRSRLWAKDERDAFVLSRDASRAKRAAEGWESVYVAASRVAEYICEHGLAVTDEREASCEVDMTTGEVIPKVWLARAEPPQEPWGSNGA